MDDELASHKGDPATGAEDRPAAKALIRDLPTSNRQFWKTTHEEHVEQQGTILDRRADGTTKRDLQPNELTVLALNEKAAKEGWGFFLHLPSRDSLKKVPVDTAGRSPPAPGALFPAVVYMDYAWSEHSQQRFFSCSHRTRLLASDALVNPPSSVTPVHCFQYVHKTTAALYATPHESFVILQTSSSFYVVRCSDLEGIVGRRPGGKDGRLQNPSLSRSGDPSLPDSCRHEGVDSLYREMLRCCRMKSPSFTAGQLRIHVPRPAAPHTGVRLGVPATTSAGGGAGPNNPSGPDTRRGRPIAQRGRNNKARKMLAEEATADEIREEKSGSEAADGARDSTASADLDLWSPASNT